VAKLRVDAPNTFEVAQGRSLARQQNVKPVAHALASGHALKHIGICLERLRKLQSQPDATPMVASVVAALAAAANILVDACSTSMSKLWFSVPLAFVACVAGFTSWRAHQVAKAHEDKHLDAAIDDVRRLSEEQAKVDAEMERALADQRAEETRIAETEEQEEAERAERGRVG
jgi:hypothetical protein